MDYSITEITEFKPFQTAVLEPNKKSEKKLREKLYALYGNLDKSASDGADVSLCYSHEITIREMLFTAHNVDVNT